MEAKQIGAIISILLFIVELIFIEPLKSKLNCSLSWSLGAPAIICGDRSLTRFKSPAEYWPL